jgi:caffeoyl-CoA O-methyltransferase
VSAARSRAIADLELEAYAAAHSTPPSKPLVRIASATRSWSRNPGMMIDAVEGRLLALLVAISGARQILEVGTFSGYSAVAMAEALPPDGHLTTLELVPDHAAKAREHILLAGLEEQVTVIEGPALESLAHLVGPFDLAFIDADKSAYPAYYDAVMAVMRPGGLIVADNVLRSGWVVDATSADAGTVAVRAFNDRAVSDPRVEVVLLTVRDGISLIRVRDGIAAPKVSGQGRSPGHGRARSAPSPR